MPLASLSTNGPIATLMLHRPEARNALSLDLLRELRARVGELAARQDVHVVVVTGAGPAFCAGMDLKAVLGNDALALELLTALAELTHALRALPQVTLARVNGAAIGGGCGMATVCDLAATHADAKLGFPEVDLGVCPAVVAPWLVRKIGMGRARSVLLRGGLMSGAEAHALGIVDHVAPGADGLDALVEGIAARLAQGGPDALRATKVLLNEIDGSTNLDLLRRAARVSAEVLATSDAQARLRARLAR